MVLRILIVIKLLLQMVRRQLSAGSLSVPLGNFIIVPMLVSNLRKLTAGDAPDYGSTGNFLPERAEVEKDAPPILKSAGRPLVEIRRFTSASEHQKVTLR